MIEPPVFTADKSMDDGSTIIKNLEFFPNIKLLDFQQCYRLNAGTEEERQVHNLRIAMQSVNNELLNPNSTDADINWVQQQQEAGFNHLANIPSQLYGENRQKVEQYLTAIYAHAKGLLLERHRDIDSARVTSKGREHEDNDTLEKTSDEYFQESREAIRALMGKSRCTIELI